MKKVKLMTPSHARKNLVNHDITLGELIEEVNIRISPNNYYHGERTSHVVTIACKSGYRFNLNYHLPANLIYVLGKRLEKKGWTIQCLKNVNHGRFHVDIVSDITYEENK